MGLESGSTTSNGIREYQEAQDYSFFLFPKYPLHCVFRHFQMQLEALYCVSGYFQMQLGALHCVFRLSG